MRYSRRETQRSVAGYGRTACATNSCFLIQKKAIRRRETMFNWAIIALVIAIIAGILGFSGIAGTATNIAWILFVVGLVLAIIFFLTGKRPRV
jgi:uncharacterized membrane protein YtjA (UPF0391 family)